MENTAAELDTLTWMEKWIVIVFIAARRIAGLVGRKAGTDVQ